MANGASFGHAAVGMCRDASTPCTICHILFRAAAGVRDGEHGLSSGTIMGVPSAVDRRTDEPTN